jgi:hypothetical protein
MITDIIATLLEGIDLDIRHIAQVFKHQQGQPNVVMLAEPNCEATNVSIPLSTMPHRPDITVWKLSQPGLYYFTTTMSQLCEEGMLLSVNVTHKVSREGKGTSVWSRISGCMELLMLGTPPFLASEVLKPGVLKTFSNFSYVMVHHLLNSMCILVRTGPTPCQAS